MWIAGLVLVIGGVLALLAPFAVSVAVTLIVGISFLLGGLLNLWAAIKSAEGRVANVLFGLLGAALGISFLVDPLGGLISLTLVVGVLFFVSGAFRIWFAWQMRDHPAFWMLLLSGALSVLLGGMIMANLFGATAILGILIGIELLFAGVGLMTLSRMQR
jgi:uncharacterized membrane protein HdeD (DUF308 family)